MADRSGPRPDNPPAWPLGCGLALLSLLLIFNLFGMTAVLAAGLAPRPSMLVALSVAALVPLAELAAALRLRRRNLYAARVLAWCLGISLALFGMFYLYTAWFDYLNGL